VSIGGQHQKPAGTDSGEGGVSQSEPLKRGIRNHYSTGVKPLIDALHHLLEGLANFDEFVAAQIRQVAYLTEHMRRHDNRAEPDYEAQKRIVVLNAETCRSFEIQDAPSIDRSNQIEDKQVGIYDNASRSVLFD
jgi:hypothetical protein